jgi:transcriptional regulator GlxA family with amidase domain
VLAYPNCSMSNISGVIDTFAVANYWHQTNSTSNEDRVPLFHCDIVTIDGNPVQDGSRIEIKPHFSIHDIKSTNFIFIPGALVPLDFIGNVPEELSAWIHKWYAKKKVMIGAACTGVFFLAETGLLNGKSATTNWMFVQDFQKLYPDVHLKSEQILTEDSGILCSGATTAFIDLCYYVIEKFGSAELMAHCSKTLLIGPNRLSQAPYSIFDSQKDHSDKKILEAQIHMEKKITEMISVEKLASKFGFSPRNFKRRFKHATGTSPLTYLQRIRIELAKSKLESTMETFDEITYQVGYENSNSFRRLFKKYTGIGPREYRDRFTLSFRNPDTPSRSVC